MIESLIELNHLRIILAIGMLGYASFTDVTKREISDYVWIIFGAIAAILLIFEPNLSESLITIGISLIVAPVAIIIWRIGLFGGADAFAIIVLAALVPQISFTDRMITPFTILTNAVLISISPLFINFFRNLIELARRHDILEEFMGFKGKALKDLDAAKSELEKRAAQIQELATKTSEQFGGAIKINSDLKGKITFLQDLISSLSRKNEELEQANKELQKQKEENVKLTKDLRNNLEKVVLKEKEIELQRDHLSRQVDEKSSELMKSEKLAIIGELASRMAHDLRNPLSTIKNTIELMESKPKLKIEEKLQYYGKLRRAMNRMSHQVDDILDFVRTSELKLQPYSVLDIINIVKDSITIPNDVTVKIEQENVRINCDYRKIEAVFTNLLLNAIQAVETKGEVHIRIIDNANDVLIAFEDSGNGIEPQNLSKIFDPLFTTKQLGTGLGLSICKSIVEQHGGNITVKNNPTTFLVRLPKNL